MKSITSIVSQVQSYSESDEGEQYRYEHGYETLVYVTAGNNYLCFFT